MKITVEFDEKLLTAARALDLLSRGLAYRENEVSLNLAFPEYGRLKIIKTEDGYKLEEIKRKK